MKSFFSNFRKKFSHLTTHLLIFDSQYYFAKITADFPIGAEFLAMLLDHTDVDALPTFVGTIHRGEGTAHLVTLIDKDNHNTVVAA